MKNIFKKIKNAIKQYRDYRLRRFCARCVSSITVLRNEYSPLATEADHIYNFILQKEDSEKE